MTSIYIEVCPPLELLLSFVRLTNEIQTSWWFLLCFRNKKKKNIVMHYAKIDNMFLIITPKRTLFCYTSIKYMLHHMLWPLFSILPYFFLLSFILILLCLFYSIDETLNNMIVQRYTTTYCFVFPWQTLLVREQTIESLFDLVI